MASRKKTPPAKSAVRKARKPQANGTLRRRSGGSHAQTKKRPRKGDHSRTRAGRARQRKPVSRNQSRDQSRDSRNAKSRRQPAGQDRNRKPRRAKSDRVQAGRSSVHAIKGKASKGSRNAGRPRRKVQPRKATARKSPKQKLERIVRSAKAAPSGLEPRSPGKKSTVPLSRLEAEERELAERRRVLKAESARLSRREVEIRRAKAAILMGTGRVHDALTSAGEWLEIVGKRAKEQGHRTRAAQALNRDGSSDIQLVIFDWPRRKAEQAWREFQYDLTETLPRLPRGVKIRFQVRVSADRLKPDSKKRERYKYLPEINGQRATYTYYRVDSSIGTAMFQLLDTIHKVTDDGWRLAAIAVDVRFDPVWLKD